MTEGLPPRIREVMQLTANGYSLDDIADELGITRNTVAGYRVKGILMSAPRQNITAAVAECIRRGWID